jgi:hypothetical protein
MQTETMKDPIVEFLKLAEQVRELCPESVADQEHGKYVSLTVSGYVGLGCSANVYFGEHCRFDVSSLAELKERLGAYNPRESRRAKLEAAKRELERLQSDIAQLETEAL